MENKEIAVLLATYNGEEYISEQLDSLLAQTYQNFVCYIHDDGSTDGTPSIIKEYTKKHPDKFIGLTYEKSGGAKNNFFSLMRKMEKREHLYYMFSDQDDVWMPEKIQILADEIKRISKDNPHRPSLVFSDLCVTDNQLKIKYDSFLRASGKNGTRTDFNFLLAENVVAGCSCIFNRALLNLAVVPVDLQNVYMHDWWIALIASAYGNIKYIDRPTVYYRQHDDNSVGTSARNSLNRKIDRIKKTLTLRIFFDAHNDVMARSRQAKELEKIKLPSQYSDIVSEFASFENKNKITRVKFMRNNRIYRNVRPWLLVICA